MEQCVVEGQSGSRNDAAVSWLARAVQLASVCVINWACLLAFLTCLPVC